MRFSPESRKVAPPSSETRSGTTETIVGGGWYLNVTASWAVSSYRRSSPPSPPSPCECAGTSLDFEGVDTIVNNLGGLGPDFGEEPIIHYVGVDGDGLYDLIVRNISYYLPNMKDASAGVAGTGASRNGISGKFGNINVAQGVETDLEFCFTHSDSGDYAPLERFFMTFYDFDRGNGGSMEVLTVSAQTSWYVNVGDDLLYANDPGTLCQVREFPVYDGVTFTDYPIYAEPDELDDGAPDGTDWQITSKYGMCPEFGNGAGEGDTFYTNYPCTEIAVTDEGGNTFSFSSTVRGFGCDNPEDPKDLTDVMRARIVGFEFVDMSCFDVNNKAAGDFNTDSGRNFLFAGASFECTCSPPVPNPPRPPPPPPVEADSPPPPPPPPQIGRASCRERV